MNNAQSPMTLCDRESGTVRPVVAQPSERANCHTSRLAGRTTNQQRRPACARSIGTWLWVAALLIGLHLPAAASTRAIPTSLLRPWDAVTFFFDSDVGSATSGPLKDPSALFSKWPQHSGAFVWIDSHTLQFRPAEPWPALARIDFVGADINVQLQTMLDSPLSSSPAAGSRDLAALQQFVLEFPTPVRSEHIRRHLSVAIRAPEARARQAEVIAPVVVAGDSLSIKQLASGGTVNKHRVLVRLPDPIAPGREVELSLRLANTADAPIWRARYVTRAGFRAESFGCVQARFPVAAGGSAYAPSTPLRCTGAKRRLAVAFSAPLAELDNDEARKLVRITPSPGALSFSASDRVLMIDAAFDAGIDYQLSLGGSAIQDRDGRALESAANSRVTVSFAPQPAFLKWSKAAGVVERFGAKQVPLSGRGDAQVDLRIHRIDALDRGFWPFPAQPLELDELQRPPGPGEEPAVFSTVDRNASADEIAARIGSLASPMYSAIVKLPLRSGGASAQFGLDLAAPLAQMGLSSEPGTYLLGLRRVTGSGKRTWMRVQVTDLALATIETAAEVRFLVTSLRSGQPVPNATIRVQGWREGDGWTDLINGDTNVLGQWNWRAGSSEAGGRVYRLVVRAGKDELVLNPATAPERFQDLRWRKDHDTWLQWTRAEPAQLSERPTRHCHLFSERPVYRPDEPVHLKGWLRERSDGVLRVVGGGGNLVVRGPGEREWRYPLELGSSGSFYHLFDEADLPTGSYWAEFDYPGWNSCGGFQFLKEDYKLPELEVAVHGPDQVPLDAPFEVSMTSRYYAGGAVAQRPLNWRVTQFPYRWRPRSMPGFLFNTRAQFSGETQLESEAVTQQLVQTDNNGGATLSINPALEPSANPRRYVVEATVTGNDGRTVTSTRQVLGLPAFALGLKVPSVVRIGRHVDAALAVVAPDGALLAKQRVVLRLLRREWHAHLRAGDRTSSAAKYVTEHVDSVVSEQTLVSDAKPSEFRFEVPQAGVYLLEAQARDRLGRIQTLRTDFYVAGDAALTWSRPASQVFKVATDRKTYTPDSIAQLVLQSPYQNAQALMVVEGPDGNRYEWLDVRSGSATVDVAIAARHAPRLAVHFLLLRGRSSTATPVRGLDLGKPVTLASTVMLPVALSANTVDVSVEHPARARPGERVMLKLKLSDDAGNPLAGEVTLWLVDQAVLALGKERRLDPLRDFVQARPSRLTMHDTRNDLFGYLPFSEAPGGGSGDTEPGDLLDNVTPRKRFVPVAFYAPRIEVGTTGEAQIEVDLPDNLTIFKLRAKAISGAQRFGHTTGAIAVRLPLLVQPMLPRFVRPGDRFSAGAVARVIDGTEGAGTIAMAVTGLTLDELGSRNSELSRRGDRFDFAVSVPRDAPASIGIKLGVERKADGVSDAFAVTLPVRPDQRERFERQALILAAGQDYDVAALEVSARAGSLQRRVVLSPQIALLHMTGAASYLQQYPYGCTEQRISKVQAALAMRRLNPKLQLPASGAAHGNQSASSAQEVAETFKWIAGAMDERELVAFWPGSEGFVSLTAWSLQLAVAVRRAEMPVPEGLETRLVRSLRRALRSDFPAFAADPAFAERAWALTALADAGLVDAAYATELARRATFLPLESLAQVIRTLAQTSQAQSDVLGALQSRLWAGIATRLQAGTERYLGLKPDLSGNPLILPGETRTLAEMLRTAEAVDAPQATRQLLKDALIGLGRGDGWGDTNANAAALMALSDGLEAAVASAQVLYRDATTQATWGIDKALTIQPVLTDSAFSLRANSRLAVRVEARYVTLGLGSDVTANVAGFVVERQWWRTAENGPMRRVELAQAGIQLSTESGAIIEEQIDIVNPQLRHHVVVVAPLAAGFELLNPALATAPPQAQPSQADSISPSYQDRRDDEMRWYFNTLPAGRYTLRFRVRAVTPGTFTQPAAYAQAMYNQALTGRSHGARVQVRVVPVKP